MTHSAYDDSIAGQAEAQCRFGPIQEQGRADHEAAAQQHGLLCPRGG